MKVKVTQGGERLVRERGQMVPVTPASPIPNGLVEVLLDGPVLCPQRIAAGRRRASGEAVDAAALADAVVAELTAGGARLFAHQ